MKAIAYIRCSTQEQADSGLGLAAQEERIKAYCLMRKFAFLSVITDAGVSGGKPLASREGGQKLLREIRRQKAKAVVVLKLDRAFRNAGDCLATVEQWERQGISLHVVDLGGNAMDTSSAVGKFMLTVLAGAAEMERNLTCERTKAALAVKRANGHRVGSVPYGFDLAGDGTTLVLNSSEQAIIEDIRAMRSAGRTLQQISGALSARRIPTKTGKSQIWTHQAVARILKRQTPCESPEIPL